MIICIPFENLLFAELLHLFAEFKQVEERLSHGRLLSQLKPWQALDWHQLKDQRGFRAHRWFVWRREVCSSTGERARTTTPTVEEHSRCN